MLESKWKCHKLYIFLYQCTRYVVLSAILVYFQVWDWAEIYFIHKTSGTRWRTSVFWLSGGLGRIVQLELYRAFAKKLMTDAKNTFDSHTGTDAENCTLRLLRASLQHRLETLKQYDVPGGPGGGGTWVRFCWVCAAGLSEPPPHYSLFCGQL